MEVLIILHKTWDVLTQTSSSVVLLPVISLPGSRWERRLQHGPLPACVSDLSGSLPAGLSNGCSPVLHPALLGAPNVVQMNRHSPNKRILTHLINTFISYVLSLSLCKGETSAETVS